MKKIFASYVTTTEYINTFVNFVGIGDRISIIIAALFGKGINISVPKPIKPIETVTTTNSTYLSKDKK